MCLKILKTLGDWIDFYKNYINGFLETPILFQVYSSNPDRLGYDGSHIDLILAYKSLIILSQFIS